MFFWIYDVPSLALGLLFAGVFVVFGAGGALLARRLVRLRLGDHSGERMSFLIKILGLFYLLLLEFYILLLELSVAGAYERYAQVKDAVAEEAASLAVLYSDTEEISAPVGDELKEILADYARYTVEVEWPLQRQGIISQEGTDKLDGFKQRLVAYKPEQAAQKVVQSVTLGTLNSYLSQRLLRVQSVETGLPGALYYVLVLGSIITVSLSWVLSTDDRSTRMVLSSLLSLSMGLLLFLTASLDYPLRGAVSIGSDAFVGVEKSVMHGQPAPGG